ncbi:MAG: hypothetical protein GXP39_09740 [Chloroflexi bacterium]|nr:hypothetical protein [Chloroflexota bacterium]
MSVKRMLLTGLAVSIVMLVAIASAHSAGVAYARPSAGTSDSGVTIPYAGRLERANGQPVADGVYDLAFALYSEPSGGDPLWTETQRDVAVQGGSFATLLGRTNAIPTEVLDSGAGWLEVSVRGPGEDRFNALSPRLRLSSVASASSASPSAGSACPHDHLGELWTGSGVWGLSVVNNYSLGNAIGVSGFAPKGVGVLGWSTNGYGVKGSSTNSFGGWFESDDDHLDLGLGGHVGRINTDGSDQESMLILSSNADIIARLDNDGGEDHQFRILNSGGSNACTVDESGNLNCAGSKSAVVQTANHGQRRLYAMESSEVWFEDFGSASLVEGEAKVGFDPIFAETVNLEVAYHVFLTPVCQEPVLLFVTDKGATGFSVRGVTLDGQPSQCAFEYRIVAKRLGYENVRLEAVNWQEED